MADKKPAILNLDGTDIELPVLTPTAGPDCLDMLWQNTLIYAGNGGTGAGVQVAAAGGSSGSRLADYRMGGRG